MEPIQYPDTLMTDAEKLNVIITAGKALRDAERKLQGMEKYFETVAQVSAQKVQIVRLQTNFDLLLTKYAVK